MVEDDALELVGKAGLAGEAEQLGVELEPGDGDAGLADIADVGQVEIIVEKLPVARGAGEIKAVIDDVLPGIEAGVQEPVVADGAVVFEDAVEAGEHFVGLAVADLIDAFGSQECGDDLGSVGLLPGAEDVIAEFEVAPFASQAVKQDHGLEHAGGGQANVMARADDVAFAGGIAEGVAEQVGHAAAGREGVQVAGEAHVGDEANEIVFMGPNVPLGPAVFIEIGAQVTIRKLALDEFNRHEIELLAQGRVAGVDPGQGGGMEPLADVLAVVGLPAGPFAVALEQAGGIELDQSVGLVDLDAAANPAAQVHPVRRLEVLPVGNLRGNPFRDEGNGCLKRSGGGGQEQGGDLECGGKRSATPLWLA